MDKVIILASGPNGLGATRSLYLKGICSSVITRDKDDITLQSRIPVSKKYIHGNTLDEQYAWLLAELKELPKDTVVIPTSDWFVTFLMKHRKKLSKNCLFIIPNDNLSDILIDKAQETKVISSIIPVPATIQKLVSREQVNEKLQLPIIIKPRSHQHMVLGAKNIVVNNQQELDDFFHKFEDRLDNLIAQEVIQGADHNQWVCNCFFDDKHKMVQAFSFNRLRLSPAHYGVTSYAISKYNEEIFELCRKLGKELGYTGPAMIEFKFNDRNARYEYIEINPRLGMCNFFDTSCNVNNVYYTYLLSRKQSLPLITPKMKEDVVFLSFYEDLFSRKRDGEKVLQILKEYAINFFKKKHFFIYFVPWDVKPSIILLLRQIKSFIKARFKK